MFMSPKMRFERAWEMIQTLKAKKPELFDPNRPELHPHIRYYDLDLRSFLKHATFNDVHEIEEYFGIH